MKRICLVATDAISFNVLFRGQLEYLVSQGHKLTLLCGGDIQEIERLRERNVGLVISIDIVRPPSPFSDFKALVRLLQHFFSARYDVIVVTTPKAILLGSVAAWLARQPRRIVFFRGRVYENFTGALRLIFRSFDWLAAWCANEVLFVSHSLMDEYRHDGRIFSRKGVVLGAGSGNGVCDSQFMPKSRGSENVRLISAELGITPDDFVVVMVGRICPDKGLAELVALVKMAAENSPSIKFVTVGPVEAGCEEAFAKLMALGNVRHVGFINEVSTYFGIANVHLFLTHREGFGNVAVEAAAMGIPTIAFDVVGVRDSVADGVSGVRVPFGNVAAVFWEIERMRLNPENTAKKYSGARQWVLDNFSQDRVWALYAEYYAR